MDNNDPSKFIRRIYSLPVLVITNPDVDSACKMSGLEYSINQILDFFSPVEPGENTTIQIVPDSSNERKHTKSVIPITHLYIKWIDISRLRTKQQFDFRYNESCASKYQPNSTHHFPAVIDESTVFSFQSIYTATEKNTITGNFAPDITPWFSNYRYQFLNAFGPSPHELFEHPVACFILTTSLDADPTETFHNQQRELINSHNKGASSHLPPYIEYKEICHCQVLVHNSSSSVSLKEARNKFNAIKLAFPETSFFITLNSLATLEQTTHLGNNASRLSKQDIASIQTMVRTFTYKLLIPNMEKTLQNIYLEVLRERSRLMHKFNILLGGRFGRKSQRSASSDGVLFQLNSFEYRERKLADWAFMLNDYALAYRTYSSLAEIYKSEASTFPDAWLYRAFALEMAAHSICMQISLKTITASSTWQKVDSLFNDAWNLYVKYNACPSAIRVGLMHAYWAQFYLQPSSLLTLKKLLDTCKLSIYEYALFQQQLALASLLRPKPRHRSYVLGMVYAGDAFFKAKQYMHALSSYVAAYIIYKNKNWHKLNNYVQFQIVKLAQLLNRPDLAIKFITALLENDFQLPHLQSSHLREYFTVMKANPLPGRILIAPMIQLTGILRLYGRDDITSDLDKEWQHLGTELMNFVIPPEKRYLTSKHKRKEKNPGNIGSVGERIFVEVDIKNKLQIPLQLTNIRIEYEVLDVDERQIEERNENTGFDLDKGLKKQASSQDLECAEGSVINADERASLQQEEEITGDIGHIPSTKESHAYLDVEGRDELFGPDERRIVLCSFIPNAIGRFLITGARFRLCDVMETVQHLPKHLEIQTTRPMPRIKLELIGWPNQEEAVYVGQIIPAKLKITNTGQIPLDNLYLALSHMQWMYSPDFSESQSAEYPRVREIKLEGLLDPNCAKELTLYYLPKTQGTYTVKWLFYYQPSRLNQLGENYRLQRAVSIIRVLDSLKITETIRPNPTCLEKYIMYITVENLTKSNSSATIGLKELRIHSDTWELKILDVYKREDARDVSNCANEKRHSSDNFEEIKKDGPPNDEDDLSCLNQASESEASESSKFTSQPSENEPLFVSQYNNVFPSLSPFHSTTIVLSIEKKQTNLDSWSTIFLSPFSSHAQEILPSHENPIAKLLDQSLCFHNSDNVTSQPSSPALSSYKTNTSKKCNQYLYSNQIKKASTSSESAFKSQYVNLRLLFLWELDHTELVPSNKNLMRNLLLGTCSIQKESWNLDTFRTDIQWICPLQVKVSFPGHVYHNFSTENFATIELNFTLYNPSDLICISWVFDALRPDEEEGQDESPIFVKNMYMWCGITHQECSKLEPGKMITFSLKAYFVCSGVFNMSRWKITAYPEDAPTKKIIIKDQAQYLITIHDSATL